MRLISAGVLLTLWNCIKQALRVSPNNVGKEFSPFRVWVRAKNYRRAMKRNSERADVFVISFPKCGRTWHRVLLGRYLAGLGGVDPRNSVRPGDLCEPVGLKRVIYTHNGTSPTHYLPAGHDLIANEVEWKGKDVVLLVRDPRDTMVSAYHHMKFRELAFNGSLSEYIREPALGIERLAAALARWHRNQNQAKSFVTMSYEELHEDPKRVIRETLAVLGARWVDEKLLDQAVEFASFDNLRMLEKTGYFRDVSMTNPSGLTEAAKVRKGKIGSYKEALSDMDIVFIEQTIESVGNPFSTLR